MVVDLSKPHRTLTGGGGRSKLPLSAVESGVPFERVTADPRRHGMHGNYITPGKQVGNNQLSRD